MLGGLAALSMFPWLGSHGAAWQRGHRPIQGIFNCLEGLGSVLPSSAMAQDGICQDPGMAFRLRSTREVERMARMGDATASPSRSPDRFRDPHAASANVWLAGDAAKTVGWASQDDPAPRAVRAATNWLLKGRDGVAMEGANTKPHSCAYRNHPLPMLRTNAGRSVACGTGGSVI
jgi:hypothetical protein